MILRAATFLLLAETRIPTPSSTWVTPSSSTGTLAAWARPDAIWAFTRAEAPPRFFPRTGAAEASFDVARAAVAAGVAALVAGLGAIRRRVTAGPWAAPESAEPFAEPESEPRLLAELREFEALVDKELRVAASPLH